MNKNKKNGWLGKSGALGLAATIGLGIFAAQPVSATTMVLLDFDGDALFPSLTFGAPTNGLAAFTGSAFGGLSAGDLYNAIVALSQLSYGPQPGGQSRDAPMVGQPVRSRCSTAATS